MTRILIRDCARCVGTGPTALNDDASDRVFESDVESSCSEVNLAGRGTSEGNLIRFHQLRPDQFSDQRIEDCHHHRGLGEIQLAINMRKTKLEIDSSVGPLNSADRAKIIRIQIAGNKTNHAVGEGSRTSASIENITDGICAVAAFLNDPLRIHGATSADNSRRRGRDLRRLEIAAAATDERKRCDEESSHFVHTS